MGGNRGKNNECYLRNKDAKRMWAFGIKQLSHTQKMLGMQFLSAVTK